MDAVPVTLGQSSPAMPPRSAQGIARVQDRCRARQIPLGGTAVGTGLNTHPEFAAASARSSPRRRV